MEELIRARDPWVIRSSSRIIAPEGYDSVSIDQLIRLRNHGVTAEFIQRMKSHGFPRRQQSERRAWLASLPPWHSRLQGRSGSISPGSLKVFLR